MYLFIFCRNCLSQTLNNLQQLKPMTVTSERSPSITLLLRFQRLLVAQIYQNKSSESQFPWERGTYWLLLTLYLYSFF